jgi:SlyX protein
LSDSIKRLEEKIAYLERHVTEQDKAMLEMAEDIARLRRELKTLRDTGAARGSATDRDEASPADDRPPHY